MRRRRGTRGLLLATAVAVVAPALSVAQSIEVTASKTEITVEEQVLLRVRVSGASGADPELPQIEGFSIAPAGQESRVSFVNGRSSSSVDYRFLLTPRATGSFEIGVATLTVGGETYRSQPFSIRVLEASERPREERELFVTARVSTTTPYVGEQVVHTWRFYRRVRVADPVLEPPVFDGFLVEDLGEVREYQATVRGQQYVVSEIRRALFPQEVGPVEITPSQLTLQVMVQSGRRRSVLDDFFSGRNTERRVLRGPTLALDVRPLPVQPAGFSGLVGDFGISAEMTRSDLKVGESATLKVTVSGEGNSQLIVEPELPPLPRFKIYADKPSSSLDRSGNQLRGRRSFSKALVPLAPGELVVPAIDLVYFDPDEELFRTASTDAIVLQVAPADGEEDLGLTESLAPTAGKVSVRIVADDILPLHKGLEAASKPGWLASSWTLVPGLLAPPLFYALAIAGHRRRERFALDGSLRRRHRALRRALDQLPERGSGNEAEQASRCLRQYVGDKLGAEGSALTPLEAADRLRSHGVAEELATAVEERLQRFEAAQYGASSGALGDDLADLGTLIKRLDREIRR